MNDIWLYAKKIFASELARHRAYIVDSYLLRVSALPNSIRKYPAPPNTTSSNTPKASDITVSEWKTHFSSEFVAPDPTLESKYGAELIEFLSVYPESKYVVTMQTIITTVSRLKRKVTFGIDNISTFHVGTHGNPLLRITPRITHANDF